MKLSIAAKQKLVKRMIKFINDNGVATLAVLLGFRDTTRIKNWVARKAIPTEFEEPMRRSMVCKITVAVK